MLKHKLKYYKLTSPWCRLIILLIGLAGIPAMFEFMYVRIPPYVVIGSMKYTVIFLAAWLIWARFYKFSNI